MRSRGHGVPPSWLDVVRPLYARGPGDGKGPAAPDYAGAVLQVRGVCHAFAERSVLDDVTFDVPAGVLMGLLGPNGAGKTTLMRIMFGVIDPDAGQTSWQGHQVTTADRRRWGYMPQERGLYPAMPAGDQLVYLARLHGVGRSEATRSARSLLDELGLADRWSDRPDKLSGGMQQRLQLAAALVHDPEVIVLDEPFAGLDPVAVAELSTTLTDRVGAGRTVLFSSHQLDLVQDLCESIVMLDEGHTVLSGRVADLRASSGRRQLRLTIAHGDRSWLAPFPQVRIVEDRADDLRLDVPAGTDPLAVLDAARAAGHVSDFGLDLPTLSQLFMVAAGEMAEVS